MFIFTRLTENSQPLPAQQSTHQDLFLGRYWLALFSKGQSSSESALCLGAVAALKPLEILYSVMKLEKKVI
jgi:hypothetical protein